MKESTHYHADVNALPSPNQVSISSETEASENTMAGQHRPAGTPRSLETNKTHSDKISDKATTAFVRRTLCSRNVLLGNGEKGHTTLRPIEEVLPPLTSSSQVDLQLYAIISVIIRDFVQAWYSKITPDQVFVSEVILIIAHCTRALEQRLQKVNLEALLFDEIPDLIQTHMNSYRLAKEQTRHASSLISEPRVVYHILHPHPALSPVPSEDLPGTIVEQRESESAWRQLLIQGLLVVLLPTEDLKNGCLRALVAEIFAEMILGNGVSGKACEGWLLWECITKVAEIPTMGGTDEPLKSDVRDLEQSVTRLERFGLLATSMDQENAPPKPLVATIWRKYKLILVSIPGLFWTVISCAFWAFMAARAVVLSLVSTTSLPSRYQASEQSFAKAQDQSQIPQMDGENAGRTPRIKRPILSMKLWSCVAQLADLNTRMPWLLGSISMLHNGALKGLGKVGDTDGVLDRFLSHAIHTRILNPALVPVVLRNLRATLFPNNAPGPPRQIPSEEEAKQIKSRCAVTLLALLPVQVAAAFFATSQRDVQLQHITEMLDSFEDAYLNKHLIYQIVELIVLRLAPELGSQGVKGLFEERII